MIVTPGCRVVANPFPGRCPWASELAPFRLKARWSGAPRLTTRGGIRVTRWRRRQRGARRTPPFSSERDGAMSPRHPFPPECQARRAFFLEFVPADAVGCRASPGIGRESGRIRLDEPREQDCEQPHHPPHPVPCNVPFDSAGPGCNQPARCLSCDAPRTAITPIHIRRFDRSPEVAKWST
jgi:hypothetical protein